MNNLDFIVELIHSLSRNEKRAFKIYASRHIIGERNKYVTLFYTLDKLKGNYSGKKIIAVLKKNNLTQSLSSDSSYLIQILVDSLCQYHSQSNSSYRINRLITAARLFFEKTFYHYSLKLLERATKEAYSYEKFNELLMILTLKRNVIIQSSINVKELEICLNAIYKEEQDILKKLSNKSDYKNISDSLFLLAKKHGISRSNIQLNKAKKIFQNKLLKNERLAMSFDAKRFLFLSQGFYYYIINDKVRNHISRVKYVELVESNVHQIIDDPNIYLSALNNVLLSSIQVLNKADFFSYLKKLREVPSKILKRDSSTFIEKRIFESSYINETDYYIRIRDFQKGLELIPQIENGLLKFDKAIEKSSELTLAFNVMCIAFCAGKYKIALFWNNKVLENYQKDVREDLVCFSKIMELIIHYEMDNMLQLPYYLKSVYRFFIKKEHKFEFEKIFLKYFPRLISASNISIQEVYKLMRRDLESLRKISNENIMFNDIDVSAWLESKINGRTYAEVIGINDEDNPRSA